MHDAIGVVIDKDELSTLKVGTHCTEVKKSRVVVSGDVGLIHMGVPVNMARVHIPLVNRRVRDEPSKESSAEIEGREVVVPHYLKPSFVQEVLKDERAIQPQTFLALLVTRGKTCRSSAMKKVLHCIFCGLDQFPALIFKSKKISHSSE